MVGGPLRPAAALKVVYVLSGTGLFGGVRVVLRHAALLRALGVEAEVVSPEPPAAWAPESHAFYRQVPDLDPRRIGEADVAVGTIFFTVPVAAAVPGAVAFHFCQGYEGLYEPARHRWPEIEATYALPTRKLAVSPHLVELIAARFGQKARWIPQPFAAEEFGPAPRPRAGDPSFRVLLTGQWDVPVKGIDWAFEALRPLAREIPGFTLVRLAQDAPAAEVEAWPDAERHVHLPPSEVPDVYRGIDLFVGASSEVEGFGLPTLEAMGSGLPCVLTDIGAFRALDPEGRASVRVPHADAAALREAVRRLARDAGARARLGCGGRALAEAFRPERTAAALLDAFREALPAGRVPDASASPAGGRGAAWLRRLFPGRSGTRG